MTEQPQLDEQERSISKDVLLAIGELFKHPATYIVMANAVSVVAAIDFTNTGEVEQWEVILGSLTALVDSALVSSVMAKTVRSKDPEKQKKSQFVVTVVLLVVIALGIAAATSQ